MPTRPARRTASRAVRSVAFAALAAVVGTSGQRAIAQVSVTTYHNDNARTGLNARETTLTPANVSVSTFGKLFSHAVDGYTYAQPLYLANVAVPGKGSHNLVIAATANNSLYAFDADDNTGINAAPLWSRSLTPAGEFVPTSDDVNTGDVVPVVGLIGTPVVDAANGTLYVVAKTKDGVGGFFHRLHALDIHTGLDKPGSPQTVSGSVSGIGDASVNGVLSFSPYLNNQRCALLLNNGVVTIAWASHGDNGPYHGWVMGYRYDETLHTFTRTGIFSSTPNGFTDPSGYPIVGGGIWMAGGGPAADTTGNVYLETGNGSFDAAQSNYGDSFVRLTPGLAYADHFAPSNQYFLDSVDADLGSGGLLLLPDTIAVNGHAPLMVGAGKEGKVYLLDRANLGQYSATQDNIAQSLPNAIGGSFGTPAYFNNSLYYVGAGDALKAFGFVTEHSLNLNYSGGFGNATGLNFNGTATLNGSRLQLTRGAANQTASAFTVGKVNVGQFAARFRFQLSNPVADGLTFTLQNGSPQALGGGGGELGYTGLSNSVAVKFDVYQNGGDPSANCTGLFLNGQSPTGGTDLTPSQIDLHSGRQFLADLNYDGTTLTVKITDLITNVSSTQTYTVNLPAVIGSPLAYAGFTAASGGAGCLAEVLDWTYAAPDASTVSMQLARQSVTGYQWPGATPAISANGVANGIVWTLNTNHFYDSGPAVLYAHDAANVANELYNSSQSLNRDNPGPAVKFTVPTVANGKVFVGAQYQVSVYGLLNGDRAALSTGYGNVRRSGGGYAIDVTLTNTGNKQADNVRLTGASLGYAPSPRPPALTTNYGTLLVGQSKTITLTFPPTANPPHSQVRFSYKGNWVTGGANRGKYSATARILLP